MTSDLATRERPIPALLHIGGCVRRAYVARDMPPDFTGGETIKPDIGFASLRRFLPYLWPADAPGLR
ncbi:MAG TPA: hypothetical protein VKQ09_05130, partial [Sphingomonas sp.]|nr:hypothetical protein [Sphingomonas sp.]